MYTATVGRMTKRISVISTKAYDPKRSTRVWNFNIPSTMRTKSANQQIPNIAANLSFLFFSFRFLSCTYGLSLPSQYQHLLPVPVGMTQVERILVVFPEQIQGCFPCDVTFHGL